MREILFRGKLIDNEEWVYGSFCMDALEQFNGLCGVDGFIRLYDNKKGKIQSYEVCRETVGQYTGLTDKNGKKIFEGDIVTGWFNHEKIIGYIFYGVEASFFVQRDGLYGVFLNNASDWLKVIGNIHDNPELLKEGDEK